MIYQIVSPVVASIQGDSFKEAIKNYVKFNHNLNITNLIIKDQADHAYEARLRYYTQNERNKVGIDVYPYTNVSYPVLAPGVGLVSPAVVSPYTTPALAINRPAVVTPYTTSALAINTPAVVTTKNSPFVATDSNVFVRRPYFY